MCTTQRIFSLPTLLCLTMALSFTFGIAFNATAQRTPESRAEWPRTFTGQPDFDFHKDEILTEYEKQPAMLPDGSPKPPPATIPDLLKADKTLIDPSGRLKNVAKAEASEEINNDLDLVNDAETALQTLSERQLPEMSISETIDLSELKKHLKDTVDQAVKRAPLHYEEINIRGLLGNLKVSAIVTQPKAYVILNNRYLYQGEALQIPVKLYPRMSDIQPAVQNALPDKSVVGEANYGQYLAVRDEVLAEFIEEKRENPKKFARTAPLTFKIVGIQPSAVSIQVLDKIYSLKLDYGQ